MTVKYRLEATVKVIFNDLGINSQDILRQASMPLDLLSRKNPLVTAEEYYRLWEAIDYVLRDDPTYPLKIGSSISAESFSPPLFAAFCSPDLNVALKRIAHYKPLVGPMRLGVHRDDQGTKVAFSGIPTDRPALASMLVMETVFWVQLVRLATREHIIPQTIHMAADLPEKAIYERYFGTSITRAAFTGLTFYPQDARRPFLTANDEMWSIFEPQLNTRMDDLAAESGFRERVRACLMEIMASGQYGMADVASRLAVSTRTLQRRLKAEGTTFQKELDNLREELARNYLTKSDYSGGQIAFLLGYEDPNSFYRAFRAWTGQTPETIRAQVQ